MNKELAKTLTTALVQFIDREQPKDKMCVSSIEAEEIERCFTEDKFERIEDWCSYRMLPELTEFEKCMLDFAKARDEYEFDSTKVVELNNKVIELAKSYSKKLLALAKKQLLSYADESNPAIEAMADLERTFECNPDKLPGWLKDELNKAFKRGQEASHEDYIKGYTNGYKDATEEYNKSVSYHFTPVTIRPLCWEPGGTCTNPQMDCVNCPRRTTGGFNTQSGTETTKVEG